MIHYLLSPQILPEPALVRFHTDLKTRTAQVLLANSITLTPGTITVEMKDGEYLIHCYDTNMIGTMTIAIIALLAAYLNESSILDICLIYAIMSFVAVIVLTKIYIGIYNEKKSRQSRIEEESQDEY